MPESDKFHFEGFDSPAYTQVPDAVFDQLMPVLSGAEFKVLLYIVRRTFGFKKLEDDISLQQIISGIKTKDGRVLDGGTGLSRDSVTKAIKSLEEKGVILRNRRSSAEKGDQPSTYSLRFRKTSEKAGDPESENRTPLSGSENLTPPLREIGPAPVRESDPQETVNQETVGQEDSNIRKPTLFYDKDRDALRLIVSDFARELGDEAPLVSTTSRTVALFKRSGLDLDTFCELLYEARGITQERSASIKMVQDGGGLLPRKNKMPYMFSVLEDLLQLENN